MAAHSQGASLGNTLAATAASDGALVVNADTLVAADVGTTASFVDADVTDVAAAADSADAYAADAADAAVVVAADAADAANTDPVTGAVDGAVDDVDEFNIYNVTDMGGAAEADEGDADVEQAAASVWEQHVDPGSGMPYYLNRCTPFMSFTFILCNIFIAVLYLNPWHHHIPEGK